MCLRDGFSLFHFFSLGLTSLLDWVPTFRGNENEIIEIQIRIFESNDIVELILHLFIK